MNSTDIPLKFPLAFGVNAAPSLTNVVPTTSQIGITAGAASLNDGFVPKNFQSRVSGGVPPKGKDFNGLLSQITAGIRYSQAGGLARFDSAFCTAIGGYPKGAMLLSTDSTRIYLNTTENNLINPDSDPATYLQFVGGTGSALNSATITLYQRTASATPPAAPSASVTYTFASGNLTGVNNGWLTSLPTSGGAYRWATQAQAIGTGTTDTIASGEWTTVASVAQDGLTGATGAPGAAGATGATGASGTNGLNNAVVYLYQRAASAPAVPSTTTTYDFATGVATGFNNGWTQAIPAGSLPLYVTIASASAVGGTDTIAGGEWATPVVLTQNGSDGANGLNAATVFLYQKTVTNSAPAAPTTTTTYTFATGVASGFGGSWTQTLPTSGGVYNWITTASALGNGATDTILAAEWATVALLSTDGAPGATGSTGATGATGSAGAAGINNAVVFLYQRAASAPVLPSATVTFTFATGVATGINNGWTQAVPAGTLPLYVTTATASAAAATDTIASGEWATAVLFVQNGVDGATGTNAATVFLYQRTSTSTAPAVPSATVTYTFATGVASGLTNSWTQTLPTTGGGFRWITTATALGTGTTDTIATGEWASPAIIGQDGAAGAPGSTGATGSAGAAGLNSATVYLFQRAAAAPAVPSTTATYDFTTGALTGQNNGWVTAVPTGTAPLYVTTATASSTSTTDTIGSGEWASPVVMTQNGVNSATVFLYQRTTGATPSVPSTTVTYTFATGNISGFNNGWSTSMPTSGSSFRWVTTASALGVDPTDTIATGEWASPSLLAQDGATGATGPTGGTGATGATGSSAQLLWLTFNAIIFTYDGTGAAVPSSQTVTATANLQNVSGTATFVCNLYNAAGGLIGTPTLGGGGTNVRTLDNVAFGSAAYAVISATLGSLSDTQTIVRVANGANGSNGSNGAAGAPGAPGSSGIAITGVLSNDAQTLPADAGGHVTSYAGAVSTLTIYSNGVDDSANWSFSKADSSGVTTSLSGHTLTLTALADATDSGYSDITAARSGYTSVVKRFTISKSKSGVYASTLNQSIGTISATWSSSPHTLQANAAIRLSNDGFIYARQGNSTATYVSTGVKFDNASSFTGTYYAQYDLLSQSGVAVLGGTGGKSKINPTTNGTPVTLQVTNGTGDASLVCTIYDSTGGNKLATFNVTLHVDSAD